VATSANLGPAASNNLSSCTRSCLPGQGKFSYVEWCWCPAWRHCWGMRLYWNWRRHRWK
jgi:hypothetical protein